MEVDEALGKLGTWGKWQFIYYTTLSFAVMFPAAWHMVAIVYIGYKPDHHCKIPPGKTLNNTIPYEDGVVSSCKMYVDFSAGNETQDCVEGWDYKGNDGPTIVTEWDLVCSKGYMKDLSQTILVVGVMVGAMGFTALSDYFGRKPIFLFSQWAMVIVGVTTAFCPNLYFFFVLRFITGALQQGIILTGFVMACELFAAKHRTFAGIMIENVWAVAWCVMPLIAFLISNWHYLQLLISLCGLLTIPLFWFLPESVPWLCANNRVEEAEAVIRNAARLNGVEMPEKILHASPAKAAASNDDKVVDKNGSFLSKLKFIKRGKADEEPAARYTLLDLFRNRRLTVYAVIMSLLWMVVTLVYYGLTLSTAKLAGDRYVNGFLNAVVEIPAYTSSFFILNRWGRRWPLVVYHIIAGVSLVLTHFIPKETADGTSLLPLIIVLNMIGKFGITGSFGIVFLYAPEIFPTTLRSQALGIASLFGRIGNTLATYTSYVIEIVPWLPGPLFGILSIGGGLLVLFLPETLNRPLPQTIEDIEAWSREPDPTAAGKVAPSADHELQSIENDVSTNKVV